MPQPRRACCACQRGVRHSLTYAESLDASVDGESHNRWTWGKAFKLFLTQVDQLLVDEFENAQVG